MSSRGSITVKLEQCLSLSGRAVVLTFSSGGDRGVDVGAIGRAVGLEPSTVRLNGHYLSRGPDLVSAVTWGSLLSFFAARGFPAGGSDSDPIAVQGRPLAAQGWCGASSGEVGSNLSSKKKLRLGDENPFKKNRIGECNSGPHFHLGGEGGCYLSFKRKVALQDERPLKKNRADECNSGTINTGDKSVSNESRSLCNIKRAKEFEEYIPFKKKKVTECSSDTADFRDDQLINDDRPCNKRRLELEDDDPFKKQKITERDAGLVNETHIFPTVIPKDEFTDSCINGRRNIMLLPCPSLSTADGKPKAVLFPISCHGFVDLGAISRALGLVPFTVRLNDHFLSRGPDLVSSVTWDSVLSFFSAREFPTGDSENNPIIVKGNSLLAPGSPCCSGREDGNHSSKRKVGLEDDSPCKKNKVIYNFGIGERAIMTA